MIVVIVMIIVVVVVVMTTKNMIIKCQKCVFLKLKIKFIKHFFYFENKCKNV